MTKIPAQIGKYRIVSQIAEGGMGAVYKAEHPTLNRFVVIKKLALHGSPALVERFRREAQIMMDFRNESIVDVYDHFKEGPFYYIVQEYVDGMSLDRLIERERYLPNDVALLIFLDCARALKYAHDRNVVHRDIKPQNILLSNDGQVKLTDFGIAASQEFDEEGLTKEGTIMGTPAYIAPEQLGNIRTVDKRADIYSLGATLYEMTTGRTPFPGNFSPETIVRIQKGKYRAPRKINPRVSPFAAKIIRRCMRTKKTRRYADLAPLIALLVRYFRKKDRKALTGVISRYVRGDEISIIPEKRFRKFRRVFVVLLVLLILGAAGTFYIYSHGYSYELFSAKRYGAVSFTVRIPAGIVPPGELDFSAIVDRLNGGTADGSSARTLRFRRVTDAEPGFAEFSTPRMYLESDSYRLKVEFENQVYVQSFFLAPRFLQRQSPADAEGKQVVTLIRSIPPQPVKISYRVMNRNTGLEISAGTALYLDIDGEWVPWDPFFAAYLRSGNTYRFMFAAERFFPVVYEVSLSPFQSDVNLQVDLVPHPGYVRVTSNSPDITYRLNNSPYYLSGGRERELRKLEPSGGTPLIIELPPGTYILTAVASEFVTRDTSLTVSSDSIVEVRVKYNDESRAIELEKAQ